MPGPLSSDDVLSLDLLAIPTRGLPWWQQAWRALGRRHYRVAANRMIGTELRVLLPEGQVSDGLSLPRIARFALDPMGISVLAAFAHDHALEHGYVLLPNRQRLIVRTRHDADRLFRTLCREINDMPAHATLLYVAVRAWALLSGRDRAPLTPVSRRRP